MRARGINYDTGLFPGTQDSRPVFEPAAVRRDMAVIARRLHCDTVRISGRDPARIRTAAELAAAEGLEIYYCPFPVDEPPARMLALFAECAADAERLRREGAAVVFVTGCETSAFGSGFLPGAGYMDRLNAMATGDLEWWTSLGDVMERFTAYLAEAAATARARFGGPVTYASGPWESVDWTLFDIVGLDAYRAAYNAASFRTELRGHLAHGKPVAITEFGTCAYRGAGERGGWAWQPPEDAVPDEDEQVRYFTELTDIFEEEGIDTALWFTFAGFNHLGDRDLGSYGVVRMLDPTHWEPKRVFGAMASRYARTTA